MGQRGEGLPHPGRHVRVERVVLGLDRATLAGVPERGVALGDEPAHPGVAGGQQGAGALGAQPAGRGKSAVKVVGKLAPVRAVAW
jgi:hypothetical protein